MKLVAFLRIKNAKHTFQNCFDKLSDLCDEIVVVDNGSTDGTLELYQRYPKVVRVVRTRGFDESRDRNLALREARKRKPDWLLWIDSDEIFEKACTRQVLTGYMSRRDVNLVVFRMFNFWLSKEKYRVDGKWLFYTARPQRPLFRSVPTAHFGPRKFHGGNILGIKGRKITSIYRIKHYGYVYPKVILERAKRDAIMGKRYPDQDKSIRCSLSDRTILKEFREFSNHFVNRWYLEVDKWRWGFWEKFEGIAIMLVKFLPHE